MIVPYFIWLSTKPEHPFILSLSKDLRFMVRQGHPERSQRAQHERLIKIATRQNGIDWVPGINSKFQPALRLK